VWEDLFCGERETMLTSGISSFLGDFLVSMVSFSLSPQCNLQAGERGSSTKERLTRKGKTVEQKEVERWRRRAKATFLGFLVAEDEIQGD